MKRLIRILVLVVALPVALGRADDPTLLSPIRVDAVHPNSRLADLLAIYGTARVHDTLVEVGEGYVCHGSRITFSSGERLEVAWRDAARREAPAFVRVMGKRWKTAEGLSLGLRLSEVAALNGRPFELSGFGWDYGGTVGAWRGGRLSYLAGEAGSGLVLRFTPERAAIAEVGAEAYAGVSGDGPPLLSNHPVLQALDPPLGAILLRFPGHDCAAFFAG